MLEGESLAIRRAVSDASVRLFMAGRCYKEARRLPVGVVVHTRERFGVVRARNGLIRVRPGRRGAFSLPVKGPAQYGRAKELATWRRLGWPESLVAAIAPDSPRVGSIDCFHGASGLC